MSLQKIKPYGYFQFREILKNVPLRQTSVVASSYAFGVGVGREHFQKWLQKVRSEQNEQNPVSVLFFLIDVFTNNERLAKENETTPFDVLIHPYKTPPPFLKSCARRLLFLPVYAMYAAHIKNAFENNKVVPRGRVFECGFLSSHHTKFRERVVLEASLHIRIVSPGLCMKNVTGNLPSQRAGLDTFVDVVRFYKQCKVVLIVENKQVDGYVSEKLLLAIAAGSAPIYFGAKNVCEYVRQDLFVVGDPNDLKTSVESAIRLSKASKPLQLSDALTEYGKNFLTTEYLSSAILV